MHLKGEAKSNPLDKQPDFYRLLFIDWHCLKTGGGGFFLWFQVVNHHFRWKTEYNLKKYLVKIFDEEIFFKSFSHGCLRLSEVV